MHGMTSLPVPLGFHCAVSSMSKNSKAKKSSNKRKRTHALDFILIELYLCRFPSFQPWCISLSIKFRDRRLYETRVNG